MLRRKIGTSLLVCGIVMFMFGISALPAQGAEPATLLLAPSPRPPLDIRQKSSSKEVKWGHITGTIIDNSTGAPVAGVSVNVGGVLVWSDINGNYDRWVPVGTYTVTLALAADQGMALQDVQTVEVKDNTATIQHLRFQGMQSVVDTPVLAPSAEMQASLNAPTTAANVTAPARLPRTGSEDNSAWTWLGLGMMLLIAGGLVGFSPFLGGRSAATMVRAQTINMKLLHSLLNTPLPKRQSNNELLTSLLEGKQRER